MIATRSPIVQLGIRAASPLALLVGTFLFFAGHNRPGGGFAAGLVFGAVIALRTVAGLGVRLNSIHCMAGGAVIASAVALAPLFGGDVLLDMVVIEGELPLLGKVKSGSALVFDAGVTLIVVGLVLALLDGLGASELAESAPTTAEVAS